jgi:hypothetical protein
MFDEETGQPIKSRDGNGYAVRTHKVPCEASIGCAKGHYNDKPDLNAYQEAVIELYNASRATGGAMLNEAERSDWWLMQAFGQMREIEEKVARNSLEAAIMGSASQWLKMLNVG